MKKDHEKYQDLPDDLFLKLDQNAYKFWLKFDECWKLNNCSSLNFVRDPVNHRFIWFMIYDTYDSKKLRFNRILTGTIKDFEDKWLCYFDD